MKKLMYLAVFMTLNVFGQESPAELGVAAIGYVVADIEASEQFYTEIIGMTPAGSFSLDKEWSKEAGAANNRPFSVKMFKMQDRKTATILKLAYFDRTDKRPDQSGVDSNAGVNYLTLNYGKKDFEEVVSRIKKANIDIIGWVKRDGYQLLFIKDPDGIFVEIVGPPD
jgi:catechol 2,3-dioxygenase-like lactoylglutathione lyase family enzyme